MNSECQSFDISHELSLWQGLSMQTNIFLSCDLDLGVNSILMTLPLDLVKSVSHSEISPWNYSVTWLKYCRYGVQSTGTTKNWRKKCFFVLKQIMFWNKISWIPRFETNWNWNFKLMVKGQKWSGCCCKVISKDVFSAILSGEGTLFSAEGKGTELAQKSIYSHFTIFSDSLSCLQSFHSMIIHTS